MRIRIALVIAAVALPVTAGVASAESDNASPKACFGQDRAAGVHLIGGSTWGDIASDRKGTNSTHNAAYRDACRP